MRHPNQKSPFDSAPRHMKLKPKDRPETVMARDVAALEAMQAKRSLKPPGKR